MIIIIIKISPPPVYGAENEDSDDSGSGSSRSGHHLISHSPDHIR